MTGGHYSEAARKPRFRGVAWADGHAHARSRDSRSRSRGSAAWGCRPGTAPRTRRRRSRRSTARSSSASSSSTPPTSTARSPGENETLVGKAIADRRDERRARDEVRQRLRGRQAKRQRAAGVRARGDRPVARAARRRPRRPLLPASRRQDGADRGDGRCDGGARRRRQGAAHRPLGGVAGDDPARARGAPGDGAAERVLAVGARAGGQRGARDGARARDRLRRILAARARLPDGCVHVARRLRRRRLPEVSAALPGRELRAQPRPRRARAGDRGARRAARPRSSRSRGCCRAATTSCRSPGRSGARTSRRTPARRTVELDDGDLARIEEAFPKHAAAGDRYADMSTIDS